MDLKSQVLAELEKNRGVAISGTKLAAKLFVSRGAVWKAIKALKNDGHAITAVTNSGYTLMPDSDILSEQSITPYLEGKAKDFKLLVYQTVNSTNRMLIDLAHNGAEAGTVIISNQQTEGRGRQGKSFHSPSNSGVYFSILLRPELDLSESILITTSLAVAVAEAIDEIADTHTLIKWVNDIFIGDKKVCGILTEASVDFESGRLDYAVVGIGINVYPSEFPSEIGGIADSILSEETADRTVRSRLVALILNKISACMDNLSSRKYIEKYRERSFLIGQKVDVIKPSITLPATVLGIDDNARLVIKYDDGKLESLSSGEVSVRKK